MVGHRRRGRSWFAPSCGEKRESARLRQGRRFFRKGERKNRCIFKKKMPQGRTVLALRRKNQGPVILRKGKEKTERVVS